MTDFEDVSPSEWYSEDVYFLSTTGVVTGYGDETYQPSGDITRAEFLTMLMRTLEEEGYASGDWSCWDCVSFSDVNYYDWYGRYVYSADELGIITGYDDGTFEPNALITRAEAVSMIVGALEVADINADIDSREMAEFTDVNSDDWYFEAVDTARRYHIVEGVTETTFEPMRNLNRAESAKMIRITLNVI